MAKYRIERRIPDRRRGSGIKLDWSMFDRIFCIHFLPYSERLPKIKEELGRIGVLDLPQFEFYYTVDNRYYPFLLLLGNGRHRNDICRLGSTYEESEDRFRNGVDLNNVCCANVGYTIDSYNLMKMCVEMGYRRVLVIEDDAKFLNDLGRLSGVFSRVPDDFDVVNFDPYTPKENLSSAMPEPENGFIRYPGGYPVYNTTCMAFSARGLKHIVGHQEKLMRPFDHYTWFETGTLNVYQAAERACI